MAWRLEAGGWHCWAALRSLMHQGRQRAGSQSRSAARGSGLDVQRLGAAAAAAAAAAAPQAGRVCTLRPQLVPGAQGAPRVRLGGQPLVPGVPVALLRHASLRPARRRPAGRWQCWRRCWPWRRCAARRATGAAAAPAGAAAAAAAAARSRGSSRDAPPPAQQRTPKRMRRHGRACPALLGHPPWATPALAGVPSSGKARGSGVTAQGMIFGACYVLRRGRAPGARSLTAGRGSCLATRAAAARASPMPQTATAWTRGRRRRRTPSSRAGGRRGGGGDRRRGGAARRARRWSLIRTRSPIRTRPRRAWPPSSHRAPCRRRRSCRRACPDLALGPLAPAARRVGRSDGARLRGWRTAPPPSCVPTLPA